MLPVVSGAWFHAIAAQADAPVAVVGNQYWPLPWYLRSFHTIGYWPQASEEMRAFSLVFAMPDNTEQTDALLRSSHAKLPRSLRANVPITLYLRNDIWERWIQTSKP